MLKEKQGTLPCPMQFGFAKGSATELDSVGGNVQIAADKHSQEPMGHDIAEPVPLQNEIALPVGSL